MTKQDEIREGMAKLEHEQWVKWSMSVAQSEDISEERLERWKGMWVPYDKLPEDVKNQDRIWANKSLSYLHSQGVVIKVDRELPQVPFNELHKNACFAYTLAQQDILKAGYVAAEPLIKETPIDYGRRGSCTGCANEPLRRTR